MSGAWGKTQTQLGFSALSLTTFSSILGPALGGALAQPCESYPAFFAKGTIFDTFPFLLPNLVCAVVLACGVIVGILFLEETHEEKKHRRDWGIEAGKWLLVRVDTSKYTKLADASMQAAPPAFEDDEEPPAYRTADGTPRSSLSRTLPTALSADDLSIKLTHPKPRNAGVQKAFTKQVVLNIIGFGIW